MIIPSKGGWISNNSGKAFYYKRNTFDNSKYESLISDSLRKTIIKDSSRPSETVLKEYLEVLKKSVPLFILFLLRIACFYLEIFYSLGTKCKQAAVVEVHSEEEAEFAVSSLKTFGRPSNTTVSLSEKKSVQMAINDTNDGMIILKDTSLSDKINNCMYSLEEIQKDLNDATGNDDKMRHIIAIISPYAGEIMNPESTFKVTLDTEHPDIDYKRLQELSEEFDSLLIRCMSENYNSVREQVNHYLKVFKRKEDFDSINSHDTYKILVISFMVTMNLFNISYDLEKFLPLIKKFVLSSSEHNFDYSQNIVNEFANILNRKIQDNTLKIISYDSNTEFNKKSNTILYKSGILSFEPETLENCILPDMESVKKIDILIKYIKENDYLYATNKNRHPIDLYDEDGRPFKLHAYSFKHTLLNKENRLRLSNIDYKDFLINSEKYFVNDFFSFASTYDNARIGKIVRKEDAENNHIYVTGQSGFGKTFCLSQLSAESIKLKHRIVIFDASNSFTHEALCRNLNQEYVNVNFTFINLEDKGIPINLFDISDCDTLPKRKNKLLGILNAASDHLGEQQVATLKNVISEVLKSNSSNIISLDDIMLELEILIEEKNKYAQAIMNRLEPIFEDLKSLKMLNDTWDYLFNSSKPAIVISMSSDCCNKSHQLIDMMLASIYNYQCANADIQLDIVIDELQNQNLSKSSPILKILKEGRKHHIAFIGATQPFHIKGDKVGDVMAFADTQIFLKPTDDSEDNVVKVLKYDRKKQRTLLHYGAWRLHY